MAPLPLRCVLGWGNSMCRRGFKSIGTMPLCRFMCAHRSSLTLSESWQTPVMFKVRFLAGRLVKGRERSFEATSSFFFFCQYIFNEKRCNWELFHCVFFHQDASPDMQHDLFRPSRDLEMRSNYDLYLSRSNNI